MNNLIAKTTIKVKNKKKEVQIYKLPASKGIVLGSKLLKLILPVLGGMADEIFSEEVKTASPKTFTEIAQRLTMQLDNFDILEIIKELLSETAIDNQEVDFDEYFMANYGELVAVLEFALKENFQSFFEVAGLKDRFFKAMGSAMDLQAESEG